MNAAADRQRKVADLKKTFERLSTGSDSDVSRMASQDEGPVPFTPNTVQAVENALNYFDNAIDEEEVEDPKAVEHSEINMSIDNKADDDLPPPPPSESLISIHSGQRDSIHSAQHSASPEVTANSPRESHIDVSPRGSSIFGSNAIDNQDTNLSNPTNSPRGSQIDSPRVSHVDSPRASQRDSIAASQVGSASALHTSNDDVTVNVTNHNGSMHAVSEDLTPEPFSNSLIQIPPPPPEETVTANNNNTKYERQTMSSYEKFKKRERKLERWQRRLVLGTGCSLILIVLVIVICVLVIVFVNAGLQRSKPAVTVQALDGETGRSAIIRDLRLLRKESKWELLKSVTTDENGQVNFGVDFETGDFKLSFANANGNSTEVSFKISANRQHVFVPIILNAKHNAVTKITCGAFTGDQLP